MSLFLHHDDLKLNLFYFRKSFDRYDYYIKRTQIKKDPPPNNITVLKGSLHVVLKRDFAEFTVKNQYAIDYYNWAKEMGVPDESYFSTLYSIHQGPML
jgi:hypothetical protein